MPIYLVIVEEYMAPGYRTIMFHILKVYETTIDEVNNHHDELQKLYGSGRRIQTWMILREVSNPFKEYTRS